MDQVNLDIGLPRYFIPAGELANDSSRQAALYAAGDLTLGAINVDLMRKWDERTVSATPANLMCLPVVTGSSTRAMMWICWMLVSNLTPSSANIFTYSPDDLFNGSVARALLNSGWTVLKLQDSGW